MISLLFAATLAAAAPDENFLRQKLGGFALVPAGQFQMGSNAPNYGGPKEKPVHSVTLSTFELQNTEVTQELWQALMGVNPTPSARDQAKTFGPEAMRCPVEGVTWDEVTQFVEKLNSASKQFSYRLPTEAEWEYACLAGGNDSPSETELDATSWNNRNSELEFAIPNTSVKMKKALARPVGKKAPNAWGLFDMRGNVSEWVFDWYDDTYYQVSPSSDPNGPVSGKQKIVRGGNYLRTGWWLRCAQRDKYNTTDRMSSSGFRLVRVPFGQQALVVPPTPVIAKAPELTQDQKNMNYSKQFNSCVASLTVDSGFDQPSASSACRLRSSKEFYTCIFHLTTFNIERINAVHACSTNPSMDFVNCVFKGTRDSIAKKDVVIGDCLKNSK